MLLMLFIIVLLVLILGVLYALVLRGAPRGGTAWQAVAQTGLVAGILAIVLTGLAAVVSFTPVFEGTLLNDPLAFAAFLGLPVALVGIGCGAVGLKSNVRSQAFTGLALSAASVAAWTIMMTIAE